MHRTAIALIGAAILASPLAAQPVPWDARSFWNGTPDNPIQRIQILRQRVDRGAADGSLDPREVARTRMALDRVTEWVRRMHYQDAGRLTPSQHAEVPGRLDQISQQIRWERRTA